MRLKWKLILVHLEIVLIFTQDRFTVSPKHTIGLDTFLDAPDGTRRRRGSSASSFRCVTIGSETVLDAPDGTPR